MKTSKAFKEWWKKSQLPQGQYEPWQYREFENLAWKAWRAGLRSVKKEVK